MKKIYLILITTLLTYSCSTFDAKVPNWVEIKPSSTNSRIYFSYGPANSREEAVAGLYKEISIYFGVDVTSVDKYIKSIESQDGVISTDQSKNSEVIISTDIKNINSIEILEEWNYKNSKWAILAALSRENELIIKKTVETENLIKNLDTNITEISDLLLKLDRDLVFVEGRYRGLNSSSLFSMSDVQLLESKYFLEDSKKSLQDLNSKLVDISKNITIVKSALNSSNQITRVLEDSSKAYLSDLETLLVSIEGVESDYNYFKGEVARLNGQFLDLEQRVKSATDLQYNTVKSDLNLLISSIKSGYSRIENIFVENQQRYVKIKNYNLNSNIEALNREFDRLEEDFNTLKNILDNIRIDKVEIIGLKSNLELNSIDNSLSQEIEELDSILSYSEIYKNRMEILYENSLEILNR